MPTACSAYGCTYRHKKGDNIGMFCFPKDECIRRLWTIAIRRSNWQPSPTSRICGKHFQSGKPSKEKNHPDYVPNVFIFNPIQKTADERRKNAHRKACQKEILHSKLHVTKHRLLKPKPDLNGMPLVPVKANEKIDIQQFIKPLIHHFPMSSENMKENDNIGKMKAAQIPDKNQKFLIQKEVKPPLPQRVWVLNFLPAKKSSNTIVENLRQVKNEAAPFASVNGNFAVLESASPIASEAIEPLYVESSITISDESTLTADSPMLYSDDSTLSAKLSTPTVDNKDSAFNIESPVVVSKSITSFNVDTVECTSGQVTKNILDNIPASTTKPVKETTDYDYSNFKSLPYDTKETLAIKLETMLAVNISLQEKVKFYQNKCKLYEKEISTLTNTVKDLKLMNSVPYDS